MSIETKIDELIAALNANTAALKGGAAAPAATAEKAETKTEAKAEKKAEAKAEKKVPAYTPKHTMEELQALGAEVRSKLGMEKAKALRSEHAGEVAKLSEITDPKKIDAVYEAFAAALEAADGDEEV